MAQRYYYALEEYSGPFGVSTAPGRVHRFESRTDRDHWCAHLFKSGRPLSPARAKLVCEGGPKRIAIHHNKKDWEGRGSRWERDEISHFLW